MTQSPHLITDVQTTPAPVSDFDMLPTIQAALATRRGVTGEHLVDAGYVTADHLVASQKEHDVTIIGASESRTRAGKPKRSKGSMWPPAWWIGTRTPSPVPTGGRVCSGCLDTTAMRIPSSIFGSRGPIATPVRHAPDCTQSASQPRTLTIRPRDQHEALQAARQRQTTAEFKQEYARRAGVEGTISQAVRTAGCAPCALYWRRQNASPKSGHRRRAQFAPRRSVVGRAATSAHTSIAFCSAGEWQRIEARVTGEFASRISAMGF